MEAELHGELIGLDVERGACFGFNGTATAIWAMIAQPRTFGELLDTLTARFDVTRDRCRTDLAALLGDMADQGLVELRPSGS